MQPYGRDPPNRTAKVHVSDLDRAVEFYTDAIGLVETARENETVYFGCGLNENFQLAVEEGGTGIEHFAVGATDAEAVDEGSGLVDQD